MSPEDDQADPTPPPVQAPPPAGPVAEASRVAALDLVRGTALAGILLVNIAGFGLTMGEALLPLDVDGAPIGDVVAWTFVRLVAELKFITLFSLLFGIGLAILHERASAAGASPALVILRRLAVLAIVGLVHGLALWFGDILFAYACIGSLVLAALCLHARTLIVAGAGVVALTMLLTTAFSGVGGFLGMYEQETEAPPVTSTSALDAMMAAGFDPSQPTWRAAEHRAQSEGPASAAFAFRAVAFALVTLAAIFSYGWKVLGLMAIGAGAWRLGFFAEGRRRAHLRLLAWGFGIGVPLELLGAATVLTGADGGFAGTMVAVFLHDVGSLGMAAGYLGSLLVLARSGRCERLVRVARAYGRMPLTNYLGQTMLALPIFQWWGLGLFGRLTRLGLLGVAVAIIAVQLALSWWWLSRFAMGPLEWAWRAVTYGRAPELRRSPDTSRGES